MLWREESGFGLLFSLTLTKKRPFLGYFSAHFRPKNFSTGSDSEPHTWQERCIYFIWRPLHRDFTGGVSFRIDIQSHPHEKGAFFSLLFFRLFFGSFSATELLYQTRLRAPHVKTMYLTYLKAHASCFDRKSQISDWYSVCHSRKRDIFQYFFSWYFWPILGNKTALPDQTPSPACLRQFI